VKSPDEAGKCRLRVEVLYVADCPSHAPTVTLLKSVLAAEGIEAEVNEVLVVDAQMASDLKFLGSPSIRIDGLDIAAESSKRGALACRLYPGSPLIGVPPIDMVRRAVVKARERGTP
jgi:hypothetical protein